MAENAFSAASRTLGDLLLTVQPARLMVPTFQRGYSWEDQHVRSFWNDISAADRPRKYFLGPIVVLNESGDITQVLDGQQRLATATILFSVIRDVASLINTQSASRFSAFVQRDFIVGDKERRQLELGEIDDTFFRQVIQFRDSNADVVSLPKATTKSHRHIQEARDFLFSSVSALVENKSPGDQLQLLEELRDAMRSDLVVASITVTSDDNAFQIFETLNDRGLKLSTPDLLLNFLMKSAPEYDRKQIRLSWNELLTVLGNHDISKFIRHFWNSRYGDLKSEKLFSALKEHLKQVKSIDFVGECVTECRTYVGILRADKETVKQAAPYVRSILKGLHAQSAIPLLMSGLRKLSLADFERLTRLIIVFIVRRMLLRLDTEELAAMLFGLAREVNAGETSDRKPVTIPVIKERLRMNSPTDEQIKAAIAKLVLPEGSADYVIRKIAESKETSTREKATSSKESNLEHIFPKNPSELEWGGPANHQMLEPYLFHVGNLTILGKRINKGAENKEYESHKRDKYRLSELKINKEICDSYSSWNRETILDRANKLAGNIIEVWSFDNPSRV